MSNEIKLTYPPGRTVYAMILDSHGQFWNNGTSAFEPYATVNLALYAISLVQVGSTQSLYLGSFPNAIGPGIYDMIGKQQLAGSPLETDPVVGQEDGFSWNGSNRLSLSDMATSGQLGMFGPIRIFRGQAITNFKFSLVSQTDHVTPFVSGIVSGQISRDGGPFGPLQSGVFTETGLGFYWVPLTSGDLLANAVALSFSALGVSGGASDSRNFSFLLQRTSGQ
jgi:hypothetical protein